MSVEDGSPVPNSQTANDPDGSIAHDPPAPAANPGPNIEWMVAVLEDLIRFSESRGLKATAQGLALSRETAIALMKGGAQLDLGGSDQRTA